MISFIVGALSAVVLGVVVEIITGGTTRILRRLHIRWSQRTSIAYDPRRDDLFVITEWSPARRLQPHRLLTTLTPREARPDQPHVASAALEREAIASKGSGDLVYLTGVRVDHRESIETQVCRVTLAESDYSEVRAIERLRQLNPESLNKADSAVASGAREYLPHAVPSSIAVNAVLITKDMDVLCAERSSAVDNAVGCWTVGIFETMKRADPNHPGAAEDLYALALRGVHEELGLYPHEFGEVMISWLGIYRPLLRGHVVAIMRLDLGRDEVEARARECDSSYEHSAFDWMPLRRSTVRSFVSAPTMSPRESVGATINVDGRTWLEQSRLAMAEAWRFRAMLND